MDVKGHKARRWGMKGRPHRLAFHARDMPQPLRAAAPAPKGSGGGVYQRRGRSGRSRRGRLGRLSARDTDRLGVGGYLTDPIEAVKVDRPTSSAATPTSSAPTC